MKRNVFYIIGGIIALFKVSFFTPASLMYVPSVMVVGIIICIFGVYPAWKVSNLAPIEKLRAD